DNAGAAATDYLQLFGFVTLGYMWARMAKVALDKIAAGGETDYLKTKLVTGRFFMERMLPETALHLARIQTGAATTMELAAEAFCADQDVAASRQAAPRHCANSA